VYCIFIIYKKPISLYFTLYLLRVRLLYKRACILRNNSSGCVVQVTQDLGLDENWGSNRAPLFCTLTVIQAYYPVSTTEFLYQSESRKPLQDERAN